MKTLILVGNPVIHRQNPRNRLTLGHFPSFAQPNQPAQVADTEIYKLGTLKHIMGGQVVGKLSKFELIWDFKANMGPPYLSSLLTTSLFALVLFCVSQWPHFSPKHHFMKMLISWQVKRDDRDTPETHETKFHLFKLGKADIAPKQTGYQSMKKANNMAADIFGLKFLTLREVLNYLSNIYELSLEAILSSVDKLLLYQVLLVWIQFVFENCVKF